ncbi:MAG: hypothetical protein IT462_13575 [Planctomycetes bacterium]|nr:hypothetical protein [Planctomycetota bacterium]
MASTITCASCGMQYDGSSLQPGVQFKCTGCGEMVLVGGAPAAVGVKRGTRKVGGGAMQGGRPAPQRAAAGRPAPGGYQNQQQQPQFGAPPKKDNTMMFVGIGIGVVVVGVLIAVVVMSGKPSPQQEQARAEEDANAKKKKEVADEDAKRKKTNDSMEAVYRGAHELGPKIAAALSAKDDGGFFKTNVDWGMMTAKQREVLQGKDGAKWLGDPLYCVGEWVKEEKEKGILVRWAGKAERGPDDMQQRFATYFGFQYQGSECTYDKALSEHEKSAFSWAVAGKRFLGKKVQINNKTSAKPLLFYCGAEEGKTNVMIIWIDDPKAKENITKKEAPYERKPRPEDDPQNLGTDPQDPMNPTRPDPGTDTTEPVELPVAVKTGDQPPAGALSNVLRDIRDGNNLSEPQIKSVQNATNSKEDKKKFLGACIDIIMDMRDKNDRSGIAAATSNLYKIFKNMLTRDQKDYIYDFQLGGDPTTDDWPVRCWYEFYQTYKA